ncbi:TPA: phage antirepressor KilAC domain-containing protein [Staphylococcus aureus]|uniref:Phage antirepressor KilAC domain-containing protein n=2 Tax=Staphylococcus aureus TaxID=1280 RepID=A0AAW4Y9G4_STAAU|nr:phage antirepressor KilAC domain-containing protein [Staphylococcus aureus]MBE7573789.1 phage antirepressor KilAC domain-containing protein [Staphylococcus aureus]MBE7590459.1 phage antirepressor KilAC domain-containing protein [Staphylococcus aureus]MCE3306268.1 phage antirepressor KilAC domain-containing protein [Staphylococcus aureus]MCE3363015.1 phage antirepressor KilAC domain-containing protein [Staphylococcus aureus]MCE3372717.1 phage antirepressor KilAC domain-containing protein [St
MQALQRFQNSQFGDLEILTIEGKQWFPATEVAMTLGYSNPRDAISRHVKRRGVVNHDVIDSLGRKQNKKFIDEGNLYRLISRSKLPQAEQFEEWVFDEVLPAIRKHGIYATDDVIEQTLKDPDYIITVLTEYKKEKEQNLLLQQEIGELKPKADYVDEILKSTGTLATTQIAADYGISAQKLNKLLHEARLQRKVNKQWVLYSEHMGKSYTDSDTITIVRSDGREDTVLQTRWTQKGRLKIHEIMTEFGYEANLGGA